MDGSRALFSSEARSWLVFCDWATSVHQDLRWYTVRLDEKFDLWICFAILDSALISTY